MRKRRTGGRWSWQSLGLELKNVNSVITATWLLTSQSAINSAAIIWPASAETGRSATRSQAASWRVPLAPRWTCLNTREKLLERRGRGEAEAPSILIPVTSITVCELTAWLLSGLLVGPASKDCGLCYFARAIGPPVRPPLAQDSPHQTDQFAFHGVVRCDND